MFGGIFGRKNEKFSDKINSLFVFFHVNNLQYVKIETLKYLKKSCRDYQIRDFLIQNGIEAYFSDCLTLILGNTFKVKDDERKNKIYFVDYIQGIDSNIDSSVNEIPEYYEKSNIENIVHVRDIK